MAEFNEKTIAKVWSQYEQVKEHVANLHAGFITAVGQLHAKALNNRLNDGEAKAYRIRAFQNLFHLKHYAILSGAILNSEDEGLKKIDGMLADWQEVTLKDLLDAVKLFEKWFAASYFYDVRVSEDNKQIIDIKATLKAAGL